MGCDMKIKFGILALALILCGSIAGDARAGHTWNNYHWARTANPIPLQVVDSVSDAWQFEFETSITEWNARPPDRPELWGISIYPEGQGPELPRRLARH